MNPVPGDGSANSGPRTAILIPALNEAKTIEIVISGFRGHVPEAEIFVCDNNCDDETAAIARRAGATVLYEHRRGKGNAIRRMFADIDADFYLMVDGDATYDPSVAPKIIGILADGGYDVVNAARKPTASAAFPTGHRFGNWLVTRLIEFAFGNLATDILSGYKGFSRRFVKTFPALSSGFEIETEIVIHAWELRLAIYELQAAYRERPQASVSKLRPLRDGLRILRLVSFLVRQDRPIAFFGALSVLLIVLSLALGVPVVLNFLATGLVPRLPTAVLAATLALCAVVSFFTGIVLDAIKQTRREMKRLSFLSQPPPPHVERRR